MKTERIFGELKKIREILENLEDWLQQDEQGDDLHDHADRMQAKQLELDRKNRQAFLNQHQKGGAK